MLSLPSNPCATVRTARFYNASSKSTNTLSHMAYDHNSTNWITKHPPSSNNILSKQKPTAERAIQTFKNHLIAGVRTVDNNFSLHLWDCLIPQTCITLNLLRIFQINPKLSAFVQVYCNFDFNCTPLAPPNTKAIIHKKLHQ